MVYHEKALHNYFIPCHSLNEHKTSLFNALTANTISEKYSTNWQRFLKVNNFDKKNKIYKQVLLIKCIKAFVGREERREFFVEYYPLHTAEYATGF